MKVTIEELEKYKACSEGIEWMKKFYPDGAEIATIIKDPRVTFQILHWGRKFLPVSQEEIELYLKKCKIEGSRFVWDSNDIKNSTVVVESEDISGSEYVKNSKNVEGSRHVFDSHHVTDSQDVWQSNYVSGSGLIVQSEKVGSSEQVLQSKDIQWSSAITQSEHINDSHYIYMSENLDNCYFCGTSKNLSHCMFCSNVLGGEYMIFNRPIGRASYENWEQELQIALQIESVKFIKVNEKNHNADERYEFSLRPDAIFEGLSKMFYANLPLMPNYSELNRLKVFLQ